MKLRDDVLAVIFCVALILLSVAATYLSLKIGAAL